MLFKIKFKEYKNHFELDLITFNFKIQCVVARTKS